MLHSVQPRQHRGGRWRAEPLVLLPASGRGVGCHPADGGVFGHRLHAFRVGLRKPADRISDLR
eukprot:8725-Eustigmatos_ZCMA.PRE.1